MKAKAKRHRLYMFRCGKCLTQEQFGAKIGYGRDAYAKVESGRREPSMKFCTAIAKAFDLTIADAMELMEID